MIIFEMWVRGHSRSLKVVPFESLGTVSYSPSIATMAVSLAISEISVKEWLDHEIWVWGRSRSLKMARFDGPCTVCPEKSEPPKHFALTSANMPCIEQN